MPIILFWVIAVLAPLSGTASAAGVPFRINFQGKLLDAFNVPRSGSIAMEFRIFDASSGGTLLWGPESLTPTVTNGVFAVQLGGGLALPPEVFTGSSVYLGVTVAPDVYPGGEMSPRQQLVASPYAFTAAQLAQSSDIRVNAGVAYATFTTAGNFLIPQGLVAATGTFTGSMTASSGTFTATGVAQYSLETSSGINIKAGTLRVAEGVSAANFSGDGAALTNVTVAAGAIDSTRLANDAVTSAKILDGTVARADVEFSTFSRVPADQTTTSAANVSVTSMTFQVPANQKWSFEFNMMNGCSGTGGVVYALVFGAGKVRAIAHGMAASEVAVTSSVITLTATDSVAFNTSALATGWTRIYGIIDNTSAGETSVTLTYSNVTGAEVATVFEGSWMRAEKDR